MIALIAVAALAGVFVLGYRFHEQAERIEELGAVLAQVLMDVYVEEDESPATISKEL